MAGDEDIPKLPQGGARMAMIIVLLASNLLASLSQSLMNVALDQVATQFHVTLSQANWMVLGYTIVCATVITLSPELLKRLGLRKVMMLGYGFALVGSFLGYFAWDYFVMIAARLLQAVCTGLFFPLITAALLTLSPKGKSGSLLAINSGVIGVGLAFAPPVAGLIVTYVGLRELFLVPAVMAIVLLVVGFFFLHNLYARQRAHIDMPSVFMSLAGLACFLYGLNEISHELFPPLPIMVIGIIIIALFAYRQMHIDEPLLNLRPFGYPVFTIGELLTIFTFMASVYMSLLIPLYLEGVASYTPFAAGCMCVLPILCYATCCFPSGHLLAKHGVWPLVFLGAAFVLVGYICMYFTSSQMLVIAMLFAAALAYASLGIFYPALKSVDLEALPRKLSSHGSSINSVLVQIGSSISSALFVGVMSGDVSRLMARGLNKADAYASGFSHALIIAIGILVVAVVTAAVYTHFARRRKGTSPLGTQ